MTIATYFKHHRAFTVYSNICLYCFLIFFFCFSFIVTSYAYLPPYKEMQKQMLYSHHPSSPLLLSDLPLDVLQPFILVEDKRFFEHFGIDLRAILRASYHNIQQGKIIQGGSTITQQLAKNLYLTKEKTFTRKLHEAWIALWLELHFDKNTLLTSYLNHVYFGPQCIGIQCASQRFFGIPPSQLNIVQASLLAGMLKSPHYYDPFKHPKRAWQRTKNVLTILANNGYISLDKLHELSRSTQHLQLRKPIN